MLFNHNTEVRPKWSLTFLDLLIVFLEDLWVFRKRACVACGFSHLYRAFVSFWFRNNPNCSNNSLANKLTQFKCWATCRLHLDHYLLNSDQFNSYFIFLLCLFGKQKNNPDTFVVTLASIRVGLVKDGVFGYYGIY